MVKRYILLIYHDITSVNLTKWQLLFSLSPIVLITCFSAFSHINISPRIVGKRDSFWLPSIWTSLHLEYPRPVRQSLPLTVEGRSFPSFPAAQEEPHDLGPPIRHNVLQTLNGKLVTQRSKDHRELILAKLPWLYRVSSNTSSVRWLVPSRGGSDSFMGYLNGILWTCFWLCGL